MIDNKYTKRPIQIDRKIGLKGLGRSILMYTNMSIERHSGTPEYRTFHIFVGYYEGQDRLSSKTQTSGTRHYTYERAYRCIMRLRIGKPQYSSVFARAKGKRLIRHEMSNSGF